MEKRGNLWLTDSNWIVIYGGRWLNEPFSVALIWIAWILLGSYLTVSKGHMGSVRNLGFLGMLCLFVFGT